jgi:glycosyltransferase involved in cell wall biosynthesis
VIPNFVDTELFAPTSKPGSADRGARLELPPRKRVPWLIRAFAAATEGTKARLVMIGDGPDQAAARGLVRELDLCGRVSFLGMRDALPAFLAPARAFLLSSADESFGLSALEAMSCGTPVVATDVGGVREVVDHGISGWL